MKKTTCAATLLLVANCSSNLLAAIIYGDFNGTPVMYLDVTETNSADQSKFGGPAIFGNQLDFRPSGFVAQSDGPSVTEQSELSFTIMSREQPVSMVIFDESGDYSLAGLGAAQAEVSVDANVSLTVTEVNGQALSPVCTDTATLVFEPNADGVFSLPDDRGTATPWTGNLAYDVDSLLASCGVAGLATKVDVVYDNKLTAVASNGGAAFIAKKDFRALTVVTVPEPSSLGLLFFALAGWGVFRRRPAS